MKSAIQEAIKESQAQIEIIKEQIKTSTTQLARRTVEKLREIAPELASELDPQFRADPKWEGLFKMSLTGDNAIPINKRGSGVRRLILLSFFRAAAETKRAKRNSPTVVYAIEEPETSQHPVQQRMMMEAFLAI